MLLLFSVVFGSPVQLSPVKSSPFDNGDDDDDITFTVPILEVDFPPERNLIL